MEKYLLKKFRPKSRGANNSDHAPVSSIDEDMLPALKALKLRREAEANQEFLEKELFAF